MCIQKPLTLAKLCDFPHILWCGPVWGNNLQFKKLASRPPNVMSNQASSLFPFLHEFLSSHLSKSIPYLLHKARMAHISYNCSFIKPTLHVANGNNIQSTNCGLNRNVCRRLTCLNIWFPSGGIVWKVIELSGGGGSLEKVGWCKCTLGIGSLAPLPVLAQLPLPPRCEMRSPATVSPCTATHVIFN